MTDTPDMPERIAAWFFKASKRDEWIMGGWSVDHDHKTTAYIRADLTGWQPIETAPKDGSYIIAWSKGTVPTVIMFDEIVGWGGRTARDEAIMVEFPPTHWMPLPTPPEESE